MAEKSHLISDVTHGVARFLEIDVDAVEVQILEAVKDTADPSEVELAQLQHELEVAANQVFLRGETAPAGDYICCGCNKHFHLLTSKTLSPCVMCDCTRFRLVTGDDESH